LRTRQRYMRLSEATVAVVGLGLMGGSLALALRGQCARLVGVARTEETARAALKAGVVDAVCSLEEAVREADIVVMATPVRHIIATIPGVAALMRPGAVLIDLGSTKARVVEAMNSIPQESGVAAIGGHPMCGKEVGGLESADATLFRGATFVLTPTLRTTDDALRLAHELVEAVGAQAVVLEAEQHDRAVAIISHLPFLLASALVQTEAQASERDRITGTLASSGFRDTSRLAASQTEMMLDILLTNRQGVEEALDLFEAQLGRARALLADPEGLKEWMIEAQKRRREMFQ
jgi:prephenate dehydrogenase